MSTNNTPTPIRLKGLKPLLQKDANECDDSLSKCVFKIVKTHLVEKHGLEVVNKSLNENFKKPTKDY